MKFDWHNGRTGAFDGLRPHLVHTLAHTLGRLLDVRALLDHFRPRLTYPRRHDWLDVRRHCDGAWVSEIIGGSYSCNTGVPGGGNEEVEPLSGIFGI
jgi:hypothetical protein